MSVYPYYKHWTDIRCAGCDSVTITVCSMEPLPENFQKPLCQQCMNISVRHAALSRSVADAIEAEWIDQMPVLTDDEQEFVEEAVERIRNTFPICKCGYTPCRPEMHAGWKPE